MINYLGKFLPQLSDISEPLRNLTKEGVKFIWSQAHEDTFNKLKKIISEPPAWQYYDLVEEVTLETDASDYGLGTVLLQKGRPVAFASRTLTQCERRYSQIEKECLSIVFGCTRFDHFLHGRAKIKVLTDHKPLETIVAKSISTAPKRLQRMMLRLQKYHLEVSYQKGSRMFISDHLSRYPSPAVPKEMKKSDDYDIFTVSDENQLMKDIEEIDPSVYHNVTDKTLKKVAEATAEDENLLTLASLITYGWPCDKTQTPFNVREYWSYRDELSVQNGIIYGGTRVLIPIAMRPRMLEQIHSAHLGKYTVLTQKDVSELLATHFIGQRSRMISNICVIIVKFAKSLNQNKPNSQCKASLFQNVDGSMLAQICLRSRRIHMLSLLITLRNIGISKS